MRRTLAVLLAVTALAAGCGEDEPVRDSSGTTTEAPANLKTTDLDDVEVEGDAGEKPTLTFEKAFGVEKTDARVLTEGDGEAIADNAVVTFDFVIVNGRDGKELASSFEEDPAELVFEEGLLQGIRKGLDGVTAGSRVLIGIAPVDGAGADETSGVRASDTLLFFAEVLGVRIPLQRAEGTAVAPVAGLPTVELADDGTPTITVPGGEPPTELVQQPLIEGEGAVVEAGQTVTVHSVGVLWATGEVFDSSWATGSPTTVEIGTGKVIPGWDEGLVGRKIGSQVLLVIPPAKAYPNGSPDGSIKATDTLVFVVDILDAG